MSFCVGWFLHLATLTRHTRSTSTHRSKLSLKCVSPEKSLILMLKLAPPILSIHSLDHHYGVTIAHITSRKLCEGKGCAHVRCLTQSSEIPKNGMNKWYNGQSVLEVLVSI